MYYEDMVRKATSREVFWSTVIILSLPIVLYSADIFHIVIPNHVFWMPVYILGIIPAIITDLLVNSFTLDVEYAKYIPGVYILLQLVFAYSIAWISRLNTISEMEMGVFHIASNQSIYNMLRLLMYFYIGIFVIYSVVSVIGALLN